MMMNKQISEGPPAGGAAINPWQPDFARGDAPSNAFTAWGRQFEQRFPVKPADYRGDYNIVTPILPDAYRYVATRLPDIITGWLTESLLDGPVCREFLPPVFDDSLHRERKRVHFNSDLFDITPPRVGPRLVQTSEQYMTSDSVRHSRGFTIEHEFWKTQAGRDRYFYTMQHMRGMAIKTVELSGMQALLEGHNPQLQFQRMLKGRSNRSIQDVAEAENRSFWMVGKCGPSGTGDQSLYRIIGAYRDALTSVKDVGPARACILPYGMIYRHMWHPSSVEYSRAGPESTKVLKQGARYFQVVDGIRIYEPERVLPDQRSGALEPLIRHRQIGAHYRMVDIKRSASQHEPYRSDLDRSIRILDLDTQSGQMSELTLKMAIENCGRFDMSNRADHFPLRTDALEMVAKGLNAGTLQKDLRMQPMRSLRDFHDPSAKGIYADAMLYRDDNNLFRVCTEFGQLEIDYYDDSDVRDFADHTLAGLAHDGAFTSQDAKDLDDGVAFAERVSNPPQRPGVAFWGLMLAAQYKFNGGVDNEAMLVNLPRNKKGGSWLRTFIEDTSDDTPLKDNPLDFVALLAGGDGALKDELAAAIAKSDSNDTVAADPDAQLDAFYRNMVKIGFIDPSDIQKVADNFKNPGRLTLYANAFAATTKPTLAGVEEGTQTWKNADDNLVDLPYFMGTFPQLKRLAKMTPSEKADFPGVQEIAYKFVKAVEKLYEIAKRVSPNNPALDAANCPVPLRSYKGESTSKKAAELDSLTAFATNIILKRYPFLSFVSAVFDDSKTPSALPPVSKARFNVFKAPAVVDTPLKDDYEDDLTDLQALGCFENTPAKGLFTADNIDKTAKFFDTTGLVAIYEEGKKQSAGKKYDFATLMAKVWKMSADAAARIASSASELAQFSQLENLADSLKTGTKSKEETANDLLRQYLLSSLLVHIGSVIAAYDPDVSTDATLKTLPPFSNGALEDVANVALAALKKGRIPFWWNKPNVDGVKDVQAFALTLPLSASEDFWRSPPAELRPYFTNWEGPKVFNAVTLPVVLRPQSHAVPSAPAEYENIQLDQNAGDTVTYSTLSANRFNRSNPRAGGNALETKASSFKPSRSKHALPSRVDDVFAQKFMWSQAATASSDRPQGWDDEEPRATADYGAASIAKRLNQNMLTRYEQVSQDYTRTAAHRCFMLLWLFMPINGHQLLTLAENNLKIPFDFLIEQPFVTLRMGTGLMCAAPPGETVIGHMNISTNDDAAYKEHLCHVSFWAGSDVLAPENYVIMKDVDCAGYISGGGVLPITDVDFASRENNYNQKSLMVFLIPRGHAQTGKKVPRIADLHDFRGRWELHIFQGKLDPAARIDYESCHYIGAFYENVTRNLLGSMIVNMGPEFNYTDFNIPLAHQNSLTWQGHQEFYNNKTNAFDIVVLNTGPLGRNIYPGFKTALLTGSVIEQSYKNVIGL